MSLKIGNSRAQFVDLAVSDHVLIILAVLIAGGSLALPFVAAWLHIPLPG